MERNCKNTGLRRNSLARPQRFQGARAESLWRLMLVQAALSFILSGFISAEAIAEVIAPPLKSAELFELTNVWTLHLRFAADQWKAIEPKGAENFRGGPGGTPRGGRFGPAMFIAPVFLKGDQDQDGQLSKSEFCALGEKWFAAWDKDQSGKLSAEMLRNGLSSTLALPQFGRLGQGPGGPDGPGGPGPSLQGS